VKYTRNTAISPVLCIQLRNYTFFFFVSYNIIVGTYSIHRDRSTRIYLIMIIFMRGFLGKILFGFRSCRLLLWDRVVTGNVIFLTGRIYFVVLEGVLLARAHTHARTHSRVESRHRRYALTRHRRRRQPPRRRSAVLAGSSSCPSGEHMLPRSPCVRLTKLRRYTLL